VTGVGGGHAKKKKCGGPQKVKIPIPFFKKIDSSILTVESFFVLAN
jgi:hypothetical protein